MPTTGPMRAMVMTMATTMGMTTGMATATATVAETEASSSVAEPRGSVSPGASARACNQTFVTCFYFVALK